MGMTEAPLMGMKEAPLFMEGLTMSGMDPPTIVRMGRVDPYPAALGPTLHRRAFKVKRYMFVLNS